MANSKGNGRSDHSESQTTIKSHGQFIRDMSFENFLAQDQNWKPLSEINHDLKLELNLTRLEKYKCLISTKVILNAKAKETPVYLLEIDYCGIFVVENLPESQIQPFMAVQCPTILYPYLRRIVSDIVQDGGFPPYNLDIINFAAIYEREMMRQATSEGARKNT